MTRRSNAMVAIQTAAVKAETEGPQLNARLQAVVREIDTLFGDAQTASLTAFWEIGRHIHDVATDPDTYLTEEQKTAHVDPTSLLIAAFAPVYTAEQLRSAEAFFEKYPSERELNRLLDLRSPDNPKWRITTSHVQLLTQIPDDDQRTALEEKCAEEALPAKTLANELQEIRGKKPGGGRKHQAPKGIKNQLYDLLQHLRRLVGRSESLWLGDENIYDDYMNTSPTKRAGVPEEHFQELGELLTKVSDVIGDHIAMYNKVAEALEDSGEQDEEVTEDEDTEDSESEIESAARRAASAAAAARRKSNITR
jgi:hypothetical protein